MPQLSINRTLPIAITRLRLGSALQNCGNVGVANAFDQSTANSLYVYDDRTLNYTDWIDTVPQFISKCFKTINSNAITIVLLPLDHRIITGTHIIQGGVCDCAILTERDLCFVEFKTNVDSHNYETIIQRAEEAIDQLWHTYDGIIKPRCAAKSIQIERQVKVDFYVVFDTELNVTEANASLQDLQSQFVEKKEFPLYFDHEKTFT